MKLRLANPAHLIVARGPSGERAIPARDYYRAAFTTALADNKVLTALRTQENVGGDIAGDTAVETVRHEIAVAGGGIGGLAAALALRARGFAVRVFEKDVDGGRRGVGLLLMRNGLDALDRLGVGARARARGVVSTRCVVRRPDGRPVEERRFAEHLGIARPALVETLAEALPPGTVESGRELADFERRGDALDVRFADGSVERVALMVAADGCRSAVRGRLFLRLVPSPVRVAELVSLVVLPQVSQRMRHEPMKIVRAGGGLRVGAVPVGEGRIVWYLTHDVRRFGPDDSPEGRRRLAARVAGWAEPVPSLVAATDFERSYLWRTADMDLPPRWSADRVVLLGDAAHPLLPFSTQGASAALEEALALADALAAATLDERGIARAFRAYESARRPVVQRYLDYGRRREAHFLDPAAVPVDPRFPWDAPEVRHRETAAAGARSTP